MEAEDRIMCIARALSLDHYACWSLRQSQKGGPNHDPHHSGEDGHRK